jgi:hypothetical protein
MTVQCDHHELPLVDGWHELVDPEGIEGTQRIPCGMTPDSLDPRERVREALGRHVRQDPENDSRCHADLQDWPCDAVVLLSEIESLRRTTALLPDELTRLAGRLEAKVPLPSNRTDYFEGWLDAIRAVQDELRSMRALIAAPSLRDDLGAAWAEAEAALPEDEPWMLELVRRGAVAGDVNPHTGWTLTAFPERYEAVAQSTWDPSGSDTDWTDPLDNPKYRMGEGPTPAAALHELALRLAGVTEGEPR